jgi:hypothetical protein
MSHTPRQIGFSQRVRLEWLEQTAALAREGHDRAAADRALQETLRDKVSVGGTSARGNREKIITILLRVWITVPSELESLRARGLEWLDRLPQSEHIAVHWGMVMAVYPFWGDVAAQVGRLVRLQGHAAAAQVQRRVRELYGERETVSRAARRVLRSYIDWGVLSETGTKGVYHVERAKTLGDAELTAWLVEATLHARSNSAAPLAELIHSPSLFPFHLGEIDAVGLVRASCCLDLFRHGLDQDLIMLRSVADQ